MLKVEGLSKTFDKGGVNEKIALGNVDLELGEGEFVTVIGGNGAGKSTLLNCIAGSYEIDRGRIMLASSDITNYPEYRRSRFIGRVFQDPLMGTARDMTIEENLAVAYAKGKPRGLRMGVCKDDKKLFRESLAVLGLGLEGRMKEKAGLLSGGQRQALTLLMATIVKPRLLLLDEHTAALDPVIADKVLKLTSEIVIQNRLCTIMVTHNMKAALEFGTRTIMMHGGRIILDIKGTQRDDMTVEQLIGKFGEKSGTKLCSDRMLLN